MLKLPDFCIEDGYNGLVCGVDEVGRGALCGPVLAAAVILDRNNVPKGIKDSKLLAPGKRRCLYSEIIGSAASVGVASVSAQEVDRVNILNASLLAMGQAVSNLGLEPDVALIDGNKVPDLDCLSRFVIGGDRLSISIAAASIVAKVERDGIMARLALQYPGYGWESNMGYGTARHLEEIRSAGITPEHRRSFRPVAEVLRQY
ncbi:MAG: ribonuclease HII [Rhodospirillaceae bacterium]|nr:ribonuclease HII [Rhodospirillaceae bacterium]|tara:strand:- start:917 stop:1525 length:609 start_codon:yes stop_codon:yes gene_type:complete